MPALDCIIPVHAKDVFRLKRCVAGARTNIPDLGKIHIVTARENFERIRAALADQDSGSLRLVSETEFLPRWRFGTIDRHAGALLQQCIKLEGGRLASTEYYLVLDSDVLFLNRTALFDADGRTLFAVDAPRPKFEAHPIGLPCHAFCSVAHHLLGSEFKLHDECYICHHMVFHQPKVRELLRSLGDPRRTSRKVVPVTEIWSEYDFYAQLIKKTYPESFRVRNQPWLDVPWSGDWDGPLLDSFLNAFKEAGVEFVAIHHHFDARLSVEDCFEFAQWALDRIDRADTRGRWPLFRFLAMKAEARASSSDVAVACGRTFGFLFKALSKALTLMVVKYAHVREGRAFRVAPAMYSESALAQLASDAKSWREAASLCMQHALAPSFRTRLSHRRWKRLEARFDEIDAAVTSVELELSRGAAEVLRRNRLSNRIDLLRRHWRQLRLQLLDNKLAPDVELESHWRGLDHSSLSAMVSFAARWVPAPVGQLSRVMGPERFQTISPLLCQGPTAETFPDHDLGVRA